MSRPLRVTELSGRAATAVRSARAGVPVDVTSHGDVVARIVPASDGQIGEAVVVGDGTAFRIPKVVRRGGPSGADQVIADRGT